MKYLKIILQTVAVLITLGSCHKESISAEEKHKELTSSLCLDSGTITPIQSFIFSEEVGTIELRERKDEVDYLIRFDSHPGEFFYSCKLSDNFKINGLKIKVTGVSYNVSCSGGCPGLIGTPLLIKETKQL